MQMIAVALSIACLAGCDALVDAEYAGEPMFRLQGIAANQRGDDVTSAGVKGAALWQSGAGAAVFTRLPLTIEFPAFWIDVMAPPRGDVVFTLGDGEPPIGEAYLHIVKPGTGAAPRAADFLATDYGHVLVHVGGEVPPDGLTAMYLGGALAPGFHVMTWTATTELTAPQQLLVERCIAHATAPPEPRASCTAQHLYRLAPAPDDLATVLRFHLEQPRR